jgi:site-specific DNA-methyltransferase (adenine-specific)
VSRPVNGIRWHGNPFFRIFAAPKGLVGGPRGDRSDAKKENVAQGGCRLLALVSAPVSVELRWPGKLAPVAPRNLFLHPGAPPQEVERYRREERAPGNLLVHGDNLLVAPWLLETLQGKVDLIYLDPPFATGRRFSLTTATGSSRRASAELDAYDDRLDDPGAFLGALAPRLALARRLLSPAGLLFLHLDARASHGAKLLLDEIFGPHRFRGEIVWIPGNGGKGRGRFFSLQHQVILAYSRGDTWTFRGDDPALRQPFAPGSLDSHFRNVDAQGRRFRRRVINGKEYVYYADQGRLVGSVWGDLPAMHANSPLFDESTGYPTQKPEKLLERILRACSRPGDLVADLCCGSGTTLVAAERLGRRWVGCDLGGLAIHTARKRLLELPGPPAFSLRSFSPRPDAPPTVRASRRSSGGKVQVVLHRFQPAVENLPEGAGRGIDLLDAWAVGVRRGGVFEGRWQAQRTRRSREIALASGWLRGDEGPLAIRAYDILGRAVTAEV